MLIRQISIGRAQLVVFSLVLLSLALALGSPQGSAGSAARECSRAAARAVIDERPGLHPFAPVFTAPGPVLCGSFLGKGSNAMVVSFKAATCGGTLGWAVFRRHAGRWNLVWRYGNGQRSIAKVGVEIKETLNILRPTDPRCVPTGGTKSRLWRWNGSRFVASAWETRYLNPEQFSSPGRHVNCEIDDAEARCDSLAEDSGSHHSARLTESGAVSTCAVSDPSVRELCFVQWIPDLPILPYGQSSEVGDFRCTSAVDGVTCVKRSAPGAGNGFRVSEDEAVEVGP
jgi:hypothetical protein